jgi:hypothetical protein
VRGEVRVRVLASEAKTPPAHTTLCLCGGFGWQAARQTLIKRTFCMTKFEEAMNAYLKLVKIELNERLDKIDRQDKIELARQAAENINSLRTEADARNYQYDKNAQDAVVKAYEQFNENMKKFEKYKDDPHLYNRLAESEKNNMGLLIEFALNSANSGKQYNAKIVEDYKNKYR